MLDQTEQRLAIIEDFRPDRNLPKYIRIEKERREKQKAKYSNNVEFELESDSTRAMIRFNPVPPIGFWGRLFSWILSLFRKPKIFIHKMSVLEFFSNIKSSAQNINIVESRAAGYNCAILKAMSTGQVALLEKLKDGLNAHRVETLMLSIGITSFVPEKTIVEFYKQSKRGLRLDYVKNFTRPVPDNLAQTKRQADELEIFDNYAVLHYDPKEKSYAETKAEKAARKDPILFGILKGRSDLYIIGDWVDDMCDLTLDGMAEILGRSVTEKLDENAQI